MAVAMTLQRITCPTLAGHERPSPPLKRRTFAQHHPPTNPWTTLSDTALRDTPCVNLIHLSSHLNMAWSAPRQNNTSPAELATNQKPEDSWTILVSFLDSISSVGSGIGNETIHWSEMDPKWW